MDIRRLVFRNLSWHARSWLLTLSGMILGTAVLTGALITGDSVQSSLKGMVGKRLGNIRCALTLPDRFLRRQLADEISRKCGMPVIGVLNTRGVASVPGNGRTLNRAEIIGVDAGFNRLWPADENGTGFPLPQAGEAVVSAGTAKELGVSPGDDIVVRIDREGFAPANAPFMAGSANTRGIRLRIRAIAGESQGGRFSLSNTQAAPANIFISQELLAEKMGVTGFINTLLAATGEKEHAADTLNRLLRETWLPADAGIVRTEPEPGLYQWISGRVFMEEAPANALKKALPGSASVLTYLVNSLSRAGFSTPYSFVAAVDPGIAPADPKPGQIVINTWLAGDLKARTGDTLSLTYYTMGLGRRLTEETAKFRVQAVVPLKNRVADRSLMPDFPGMIQSGNCRDWETGTPVDLARIRDKDEQYWKEYRGTPKAWITLADGQRLWKNPFGQVTAIRTWENPSTGRINEAFRRLDPSVIGGVFVPVFEEGLRASGGSADFGELFLGLGALVVVSGLLLSGMLLSFYLGQRKREGELMRALGFTNRRITALLLPEVLSVSVAGGIAGVALAILYSRLIVAGLNTLWQGAVNTSSLEIAVHAGTLLRGFLTGVLLNGILFSAVLFRSRRKALPSVYSGTGNAMNPGHRVKIIAGTVTAMLAVATAVVLILYESGAGRFYPSATFMLAGVLILAALLVSAWLFLTNAILTSRDLSGRVISLVIRNASGRKTRTLVAIALIALGTFTILVTGLNRRAGKHGSEETSGGTGGFGLWMESSLPVETDLNSPDGRAKAGLDKIPVLKGCRFIPLPGIPGDDASCLNLNRVARPGVLGVPARFFDARNAFSFVNLLPGADRDHPWALPEVPAGPRIINGFADQTVITWGLQKKIGDTLFYTGEQGEILGIRLAGGLENSLFQGSILVSDSLIRVFFPSAARVRTILVDVPGSIADTLARLLEDRFRDRGAVVRPAAERLAAFDAVENTYLDLFLLLGSFGLIVGTAGLAVLVMKSKREKSEEMALQSALGFPRKLICRLFTGEHLFILLAGITAGILAAVTGTLPVFFRDPAGAGSILGILAGIISINGIVWILLPLKPWTYFTPRYFPRMLYRSTVRKGFDR